MLFNIYGSSEQTLAVAGAPSKFTISTKSPGLIPWALTKSSVIAAAGKSLDKLGVAQVDTYFLHSPDSETPLEEMLSAVQDLYEAGKFVLKAGIQGDRWDKDTPTGQMYLRLYGKPKLLEALYDLDAIAEEAMVTKAALAYR
ncbi:hypothetical protein V1527DRAFT_514623 [Lipomyces starkeyi]